MTQNDLIVVQGHDHSLLLNRQLDTLDMHWISASAPGLSAKYAAKTRYRQQDAECHITLSADDTALFTFDAAQWAVTPGQSVVVYDGEVCLGGGIIK
jgi:tRNA-specific 2-thiouridylase